MDRDSSAPGRARVTPAPRQFIPCIRWGPSRAGRARGGGPALKITCALSSLPTFTAAGSGDVPHRAMVTIARSLDETQAAYERSRAGEPSPRWAELYFHSAYAPSL